MWTWVVPVVVGFTIAVQSAILGSWSGSKSPAGISLSLAIAGAIVGAGWATVTRRWPDVLDVALQWWWLPLGVAGWLIVAALGWSAARLGVSAALALVVAAQLIGGLVLDAAFGRTGMSWGAGFGVVLIVGGVLLLVEPS